MLLTLVPCRRLQRAKERSGAAATEHEDDKYMDEDDLKIARRMGTTGIEIGESIDYNGRKIEWTEELDDHYRQSPRHTGIEQLINELRQKGHEPIEVEAGELGDGETDRGATPHVSTETRAEEKSGAAATEHGDDKYMDEDDLKIARRMRATGISIGESIEYNGTQ